MHQSRPGIRHQLICCFIHTYTQTTQRPPSVREIGVWVGARGIRSLQRDLARLEAGGYLRRERLAGRSIALTEQGLALSRRWHLRLSTAEA